MKGTCRKCGCTNDRACFHTELGPCSWADDDHELCTYCLPQFEHDCCIERPAADEIYQ